MQKKYVVWTWFDENDIPKFVGWGRHGRSHPAKKLWAQRSGMDSDLNIWLQSFKSEPKRIDHSGIVWYYKYEAAAVSTAYRDKYKDQGFKLLDPRPWGTKEGGGAARMVMSPDFTIYGSVRQAAVDECVNPCTITRWCQSEDSDWDYLN